MPIAGHVVTAESSTYGINPRILLAGFVRIWDYKFDRNILNCVLQSVYLSVDYGKPSFVGVVYSPADDWGMGYLGWSNIGIIAIGFFIIQ